MGKKDMHIVHWETSRTLVTWKRKDKMGRRISE